ncbi:MAG: Membrane fusion component of tripartite multidrug resistance system [Proteobacteria bacterium]|nr:Membrane fusion component of tripartite multidrug resistance system [Pseudomonadota bacterium]
METQMTQAAPNTTRRRLFTLLAAAFAVSAVGYGVYWYVQASRYVSTDNAYAAAEVAQVTPSVGGTVAEVKVIDTQNVKKGDVLVVIDDTDARLALQLAEAEYGRAIRKVRGMVATDTGLAAQIAARDADETRTAAQLQAAQADFERAQIDLQRRQALAKSGSVSGDELTRAQNAYATAKANLEVAGAAATQARANRTAAVGSREANRALIDNSSVDTNPEVAVARARRDQARVDLERTIVRAPVDGVVARRQVQVGQRVQAGASLLSVVPVTEMHVDANFKEVQLQDVKPGQVVEVQSDLYGDKVAYRGIVTGFSGGTGSAFSLIPAQNATGNWIKVVQRLPVRIKLDAADLVKYPLQVGLSMHVKIDTRSGK